MEPPGLFSELQNFPIVVKNKINNWKMLRYTQEDWCKIFNNRVLNFRQGENTPTKTPYWEGLCKTKEMTLDEFFELSNKNSDHWLYFDYKYIKDIFSQGESFIHDVHWADVGLFDLPVGESALWIGNKGAHTPCHKDTYGCNLVAQLFGRKLWILMPPEESENLKAVRVPYEESSVYSAYNFFAPQNDLLDVKEAYKVVLSPGEVLYVPHHWWHYVENLEPAISINIWIPLDEDHENRLEEALVQHYISNICQNLSKKEAEQILNPNEYSLISQPTTLELIEKCLENYKEHKKKNHIDKDIQMKLKCQGETVGIDKLYIKDFIKEKTSKLGLPVRNEFLAESTKKLSIAETLINAYCSQSNLSLVKKALLQ